MADSFIMPIEIFSMEGEGLDFVIKDLTSKGWKMGWKMYQNFRVLKEGPNSCNFWVPSDKLKSFRKDLSDSCLPFGLKPEYTKDYILLLNKEDN